MLPFILRRSLPFAALALSLALAGPAGAKPSDWFAEIDALTRDDAAHPPPAGAVVFAGSSSIRLWATLREDLPGLEIIQRGFGGSALADTVAFADRIILPYRPRAVVVYAGDNDIAGGRTPEEVAADFAALVALVRARLPAAHLYFLSIKPSPSRARFMPAAARANALVAAQCGRDPHLHYVDLWTPMLDAAGRPRPELFGPDLLHLNHDGYRLWAARLGPLLRPE